MQETILVHDLLVNVAKLENHLDNNCREKLHHVKGGSSYLKSEENANVDLKKCS